MKSICNSFISPSQKQSIKFSLKNRSKFCVVCRLGLTLVHMIRLRTSLLFYQRFLSMLIVIVFIQASCMQPPEIHSNPISSWATPEKAEVHRIGDFTNNPYVSNTFSNTDCYTISFRVKDSDEMSSGCFSQSSIGLMEVGGGSVIFSGSDEALSLIPSAKGQVLVPWPGSGRLVSLVPLATGGMRLGVYLFPRASLEDNKPLGYLISKRLTTSPQVINSALGKPLDINPQTLAFSSNGKWLVAETLGGSFVRVSAYNFDTLAFAQSFSLPGSDMLLDSYISVSNDGQYVAIYSQDADTFRVYDLESCTLGPRSNLEIAPMECAFHDYMPLIKNGLSSVQALRRLRFLNEGTLDFQVVASGNASDIGIYALSPDQYTGPLVNYLALGDSYTSGEGAFDYTYGTDSSSNKCHLSLNSYPFLMFISMQGESHSVACSGAVIKDIGSTDLSYRGQASDKPAQKSIYSFVPGYISQHNFVAKYQPAIVTVSIGGNDIGFGDIIASCVLIHLDSNNCFSSYEDRLELKQLIDRTRLRLASLYSQLLSEAPVTKLYIIGYPQIAYKDGSCAVNVRLSRQELQFAEQAINYLNDSIQSAAAEAGANFVDISHALDGHRLCESNSPAINGLTAGNDKGPLGHESYHPNAFGHQLIAQAILNKTDSFSKPQPAKNHIHSLPLLDAPVTGRQTVSIQPGQGISPLEILPGEEFVVSVEGQDYGLRAGSPYVVALDGVEIGSFISDNASSFSGTVTAPSFIGAGVHSLEVTGTDLAGSTTNISQLVYVDRTDGISIKVSSLSAKG